MNYKSLNESILSVTNPQPKLVEEDYQTPDRAAQSRNIVGDAVDRANNSETDRQDKIRNRKLTKVSNRHEMERKSKKTYGMGGKIVKKATVKEEQEYTELLETIIVTIANELNIPPQELIEGFLKEELSEGLRKKIMHGLKVAVTGGALLAGTAGAAHQLAKPEWTTPRHHSPSSQVQKADSKTTQSTSAAKAKAKAKANSDDYYPPGQIIRGVDNSSLFSN